LTALPGCPHAHPHAVSLATTRAWITISLLFSFKKPYRSGVNRSTRIAKEEDVGAQRDKLVAEGDALLEVVDSGIGMHQVNPCDKPVCLYYFQHALLCCLDIWVMQLTG